MILLLFKEGWSEVEIKLNAWIENQTGVVKVEVYKVGEYKPLRREVTKFKKVNGNSAKLK
jgi:hypothetical protein